jgi:hypothetical protein
MTRLYRLDGHNVVKCANVAEWDEGFEGDHCVALTEVDHVTVSTVFLGVSHGFRNAAPIVFETMCFAKGGDAVEGFDRYATWEDAEAGHAAIVETWRKKLAEPGD